MIPAHAAAVRSIRNVVGKYTEIKRGNIGMGLVELDSSQCIKIVADYLLTSSTIAYHLVSAAKECIELYFIIIRRYRIFRCQMCSF